VVSLDISFKPLEMCKYGERINGEAAQLLLGLWTTRRLVSKRGSELSLHSGLRDVALTDASRRGDQGRKRHVVYIDHV